MPLLQTLPPDLIDLPISFTMNKRASPYLTWFYNTNKIGLETIEGFCLRWMNVTAKSAWNIEQERIKREENRSTIETLRAEGEVFIKS